MHGLLLAWLLVQSYNIDMVANPTRWFQLRRALQDKNAPPLYRGVAAFAFHDWPVAERELESVMKSAQPTDPEALAYALLANSILFKLYWACGRYGSASDAIETGAKIAAQLQSALPQAPTVSDNLYRPLFTILRQYPDQLVAARGPSRVMYEQIDNHLVVPVSVNGVTANYVLDTGAGNSISESEAKRLNLKVHPVSVSIEGFAGAHDTKGVVVVDDLVIGNVHLRRVAFTVSADDEDGVDGLLGLPVLFALGTLRWKSNGDLEFGFPSPPPTSGSADLSFTGNVFVTEARFQNRKLLFSLDTGAAVTGMYPLFGKPLGDLPELRFQFGNFTTILTAGHPSGPEFKPLAGVHGNLGLDLLGQAESTTLDFNTMKLTMRGGNPAPVLGSKSCMLPPAFSCQAGFTCTVHFVPEIRCYIDRERSKPDADDEDACRLPANFTCAPGKVCTVDPKCRVTSSARPTRKSSR